ncbi:aminoglycoside phosphotransferase family protein [Catellatospora tritici]|uniref:aminoglycoside phosphotransferase family protein n=1 Tax=Catellatospora tritici TaxID=2851566 RepID=UPI001C2D973E|nr:aminoglycoside phosphotransferase family protein [Catellatospora tritici]MBV1854795.1 aminoglycoside phosphotransferase family protein [Catellatospora tritici]
MDAGSTAAVLAEVNAAHGTGWTLVRRLDGGAQSGAHLVRDDSGGQAVLKWSTRTAWAPQVLRAAPVIARMRQRGWPTPAWLAVGTTRAGWPYQVQEFVAGEPVRRLGPAEVRLLLALVDSHAGLDPDPGRDWSWYVRAEVFDGHDGFRDRVRDSGPDGARVVRTYLELCEPYRDLPLPTGDLVHGDLGTQNVLVADGVITGVVDVEALGSGTRAIDLAGLLRQGWVDGADPEALARLRHAAEAVAGPGVLAVCTAATVFGMLDWLLARAPDEVAHCAAAALRLAADLRRSG